jgi:integrase
VSGNRERAALSSTYEFAMRNGLARRNPCRGVKRNKERPSKKNLNSVTLAADFDRAPPHFALVLQFAYITGMREEDIINLEVGAATPAGIEWTESKTDKDAVIAWTPTLRGLFREIMEARNALDPQPEHTRLLTNRFGEPLTMWGITSNVRRLKVDWTFRDLRPKAQTDAGDRNVLGHVGQMRERYTRRSKRVPVH